MKCWLGLFCWLWAFGLVDAQQIYEDRIYDDHIATVKFHVNGLALSNPITDLNGGAPLVLTFDDVGPVERNFYYRIVHCDMDWTASDLADIEYLEGFADDRIFNFNYSFKTVTPYTHYRLALPNNNVRWTKSGNYALLIYDDSSFENLVLSRRFLVVDRRLTIIPRLVRPQQASKIRTHQEIDFVVRYENFPLRAPLQEIKATVLQNNRWDIAKYNIPPLFERPQELIFDYQDKIIFPAGKEFRFFDIRTLRAGSENVAEIQEYDDGFDVLLFMDKLRNRENYVLRQDINGRFIIETRDQNNDALASDYANVLFSLDTRRTYPDQDIYLMGALTDWHLQDRYKLIYNEALSAYVTRAFLKQGYYEYQYVMVDKTGPQRRPAIETTEGNWYETENVYTILIYYRPFGGRYDQLLGAVSFDSAE